MCLGFVYLRLRSTRAAAMTAMMMTTAAPAMSKVSVEMLVPGVGATVGEILGAIVTVGAIVGAIVCVGIGVIGADAADTTPRAVCATDGQ